MNSIAQTNKPPFLVLLRLYNNSYLARRNPQHYLKKVGLDFLAQRKKVTQQLIDYWGNVGLRYRAPLDKLTQPTA